MSGVQVSVTEIGMSGVLNRLRRAKATITGETIMTLNEAIANARRTAQDGTPVRTGMARAGWATEQTGPLSRRLYNPVVYVPFLVMGTRYMAASVVLNAALEQARKDMDRDLLALGVKLAPILHKDY